MVRQGEEHAAADLLIKERIEAVNQGKLFFENVLIILDIVVSLSDLSFMMKPLRLKDPFGRKNSIKATKFCEIFPLLRFCKIFWPSQNMYVYEL